MVTILRIGHIDVEVGIVSGDYKFESYDKSLLYHKS